jgi:hypothetical protein
MAAMANRGVEGAAVSVRLTPVLPVKPQIMRKDFLRWREGQTMLYVRRKDLRSTAGKATLFNSFTTNSVDLALPPRHLQLPLLCAANLPF